jgi:hypothetical protein
MDDGLGIGVVNKGPKHERLNNFQQSSISLSIQVVIFDGLGEHRAIQIHV